MKSNRVSNQRLLTLLGVLAVIANLFVFALVAYSIHESRIAIDRAASVETMNLATTLEHTLSEKFRLVDFALLTAQREFYHQKQQKTLSGGSLSPFLQQIAETLPELDGLRITDENGLIQFNIPDTSKPPVSLADRDYFLYIKTHQDNQPYTGQAIKSRVTGHWVIPIARRLNDEHGQFLGMVYATIRVSELTREFVGLTLNENDAMFLRDAELRLITRHPLPPEAEKTIGFKNASPELTSRVRDGIQADTYIPSKTSDGIERIYSFRKLRDIPMYVMVAKSNQVYLAPWRTQATRYIGFASLFLLVSMLAFRQLRLSLNAQEASSKELEQTKNTLETVTQFSSDWIYWRNQSRDQFVYNSPLCERITGYSEAEFASKPVLLDEIIHPDDAERWLAHFDCTEQHADDEYRIVTKTGETRWINHGCRQVYDANGQRLGRRGSNVDITTKKLAEFALRDAIDAANAANAAKSRFLAVMSHELRTPLNGIMGMSQMLMMEGISNEERISFAQTILESGNTLLGLLNDILDHAKIEAGRMELAQNAFDPSHVAHEVVELFSETAHQKQIMLNFESQIQDQQYIGDPLRLRQILTNLINNAIKFTDGGRVDVELCLAGADHSALRFSVKDTGIGIPPEKQASLFKPFSQVDDSTTRRHDGTGLGLAICHNLVRIMNGEMGVNSEAGKGSTFWFEIPLPAVTLVEEAAQSNTDEVLPNDNRTNPARVLVVDDNQTNRKVVLSLLKKLGFSNTVEATNGSEAIETVENRGPFEIILMDCLMPVMDGFEATQQIRRWESEQKKSPAKIIALTASAYEEDRQHCLTVGMNAFISKPIHFKELRQALLDE